MRIKHYIGLIGWENLNFNKDDYVFCDSIVLFYLARIFGKKLELLPGAKMVANRNFSKKSIFLLPHEIKSLKNMKKYILPNYKEDIYVEKELKDFLESNNCMEPLYICISTPKQNILGQKIAKFYDGEIHCIGAAIDIKVKNDEKSTLILSKLNLLFLLFLFRRPLRTISKIREIFVEVYKIAFIHSHRLKFKAFVESLNRFEVN